MVYFREVNCTVTDFGPRGGAAGLSKPDRPNPLWPPYYTLVMTWHIVSCYPLNGEKKVKCRVLPRKVHYPKMDSLEVIKDDLWFLCTALAPLRLTCDWWLNKNYLISPKTQIVSIYSSIHFSSVLIIGVGRADPLKWKVPFHSHRHANQAMEIHSSAEKTANETRWIVRGQERVRFGWNGSDKLILYARRSGSRNRAINWINWQNCMTFSDRGNFWKYVPVIWLI